MTITEFLEARITEDEAMARHRPKMIDVYDAVEAAVTEPMRARVLAECAAKRAIIAEHAPVDYSGIGMESPNACRLCGADLGMGDWEWVQNSFPCKTLQALTSTYADHPDYQQEWAK